MKRYLSLLRVRFLNDLQYREAAIGGIATQFFWGVMLIFVYKAFYAQPISTGGFTYENLVTFVWLQQAFLSFIFIYDWDHELLDMITTGAIGYELTRPINLYNVWFMKLLSKRLARGILRFAPVIILGCLMKKPYKIALPHSGLSFMLFILTLCLGLVLLVSISMLIYISIFKTMSPLGSIGILSAIGDFFSGTAVPIPLMPEWLQKVCLLLPFRWISDLPFRLYTGNIAVGEGLMGVAVQLFWIVLLIFIGRFVMDRVTKLSVIQGG
jgi:ABC-2 type transport system permease protein